MYEHFTDRCRKVMQFANQEACRFNHEYVGTEHILLGFLKEGTGTGIQVLKAICPDSSSVPPGQVPTGQLPFLSKIRLEVEKLLHPGPDIVTMGKLPMTPRAKKVVKLAIKEAQRFQHNYVGTEHVLLGMLLEREGIACQVLNILDVTHDRAETEVLKVLALREAPNQASWELRFSVQGKTLDEFRTEELEAELARRRDAKELEKRTALEERARWLKAVISKTQRPDPKQLWANELTGDYDGSFHPTREEAEAAALTYVERKNRE